MHWLLAASCYCDLRPAHAHTAKAIMYALVCMYFCRHTPGEGEAVGLGDGEGGFGEGESGFGEGEGGFGEGEGGLGDGEGGFGEGEGGLGDGEGGLGLGDGGLGDGEGGFGEGDGGFGEGDGGGAFGSAHLLLMQIRLPSQSLYVTQGSPRQ